jgi:hypothetical protein
VVVLAVLFVNCCIKIRRRFRIMWLRLIWVEPLAHFLFLSLLGISVAVSGSVNLPSWRCGMRNIHKVFLLNLIPTRASFLPSSDTLDIFRLVIFYNKIDELTSF